MRAPLLITLFLLLAAPAPGLPADGPATLRIGTITIRNLDVFTPTEAQKGWFYSATNVVHLETRPSVIRRFLLFDEGDPFEPERLAESERNLRKLGFLKSATITAEPPHDGVVDVLVETEDAWSTEPSVSLGSRGGTTSYGFSLSESNLLGTGRELALNYDHGVDRTIQNIEIHDPALIRPYDDLSLVYSSNSDGSERRLRFQRSFFAFTAPTAYSLDLGDYERHDRLFADSFETARFSHRHRGYGAGYGFALMADELHAKRLTAGIDLLDDRFAPLPDHPAGDLPDDRRFRYLTLRYDDIGNDFLKLNYVNKDLRYEDFNLAPRFSILAGLSPAALGADRTTGLIAVRMARGWSFGDQRGFVLPVLAWESRVGGGTENEILNLEVQAVRKFATAHPQTLLYRIHLDRGWNLDRDVQFFADGSTGLRGYRLHAFAGDKAVIMNLEHRIYLGREILQLVSPGVAVFADTGVATPPGEALSFGDLHTDLGIGLRIGLARTPRNLFRLDVGWALDPDPRGRRGLLVSFSSAQAF